ncbi:MAG TPA: PQQ-binding-like beta-propeller repeat protein [Blastocatellia bacterium]|nr:PQQ-binding-like beta-propeller repeat protein [Blastocatellia bacterium]
MKHFAFFLVLVLLSTSAFAQESFDWPQWQGPDRNAISKERGLLQTWPEKGPPLVWKAKGIGSGMGGIAVSKGRIYTAGDVGDASWVFALKEATGELIWKAKLGRSGEVGMMVTPSGPRGTPTVDGDRLYIMSQFGELVCYTTEGKEVWRTDFVKDHGGIVPTWGYAESVLVDGEKLICTPGAPDATLVALNKMTGKTIWRSQVPMPINQGGQGGPGGQGGRRGGPPNRGPESGASYASIIAIDFEGQRQYVQLTAKTLAGFSASDGKLLWQYDPVAAIISCSTPIYQDGLVFASSAYDGGGGAVKLSKDADGKIKATEVYFTNHMRNHHGGMIVVDGALYGAAGGNEGGFLVCLDFKTGGVLWRERQAPKGSLAMADGRLYLRAESGTMILIEPNREKYIERGRFEQPDRTREQAWTHPVIANGKLYVRDQDLLLCYDVKKK